MHLLVNFAVFQAGWFSSVLGAAGDRPWLGPLVLLLVLVLHLRLARQPVLELGLVVACGIVGVYFDSALVALGWVSYPNGQWHAAMAPYWIVAMWMLFGTTLNVSLRWLRGRWLLAAVLGGVAGPLSYLAGQSLGGMVFVNPVSATVALSIGWAAVMPMLMHLATELDGMNAPAGDRLR